MAQISLENMRFYAYHGCFKEEAETGTEFQVDLYINTDTHTAEKSDQLTDTVNYQALYELVKRNMKIRSNLLENVTHRILKDLHENFPQIEEAELTLSKLHPPIGGQVGSVSVTMALSDILG